MSHKSEKRSKTIRYPSWFRQIILYLYGVSLFSIGAAVVLIIVITAKGELFTANGYFLILYLSVFMVLFYLKKRFEKDE